MFWCLSKRGRWFHKHCGCRLEQTGPVGTYLGYINTWECRTWDCYRKRKWLVENTGYPFLPYWA